MVCVCCVCAVVQYASVLLLVLVKQDAVSDMDFFTQLNNLATKQLAELSRVVHDSYGRLRAYVAVWLTVWLQCG